MKKIKPKYIKNNERLCFFNSFKTKPNNININEKTPISNEKIKTVNVVPILVPSNIAKADFVLIRLAERKAINNMVTALDDDVIIVIKIPNKNDK